jgi:hypothetical protein
MARSNDRATPREEVVRTASESNIKELATLLARGCLRLRAGERDAEHARAQESDHASPIPVDVAGRDKHELVPGERL